MSRQEIDRVDVIKSIKEKKLRQKEGAKQLGLSIRQMRRLMRRYAELGVDGIISTRRGKASNNRCSDSFKNKVKKMMTKHYNDFGPTFASEKLLAVHDLKVSKETLRQWMVSWGFRHATPRKKAKLHQSRARRERFGELVQIDGSHHDWFEGRGEKCCLLVFIDDATSRLFGLRFTKQETTLGYFATARDYIKTYGRPGAFYSDKFSVFRVNTPDCQNGETQWGRAMRELGIEVICAHSPQAKGRVEKANRTLQDRLIKEMRLKKISTIEEANAYVPTFIEFWNGRFSCEPKNKVDAHRKKLPSDAELDLILSVQIDRKLSKNLQISYENEIYQIKQNEKNDPISRGYVTIHQNISGEMVILQQGQVLNYSKFQTACRAPQILNAKQLEAKPKGRLKEDRKGKEPWRHYKKVQLPTTHTSL